MDILQARRRHLLVAIGSAALLGAASRSAIARPGYSDPAIRAQVKPGMSQDEVTALLGRATKTRKYREGSTWGYQIASETWFLVDFGTDGKVKEASQKVIPAW